MRHQWPVVWHVARRECRDWSRDGIARLLGCCLLLLLAAAMSGGIAAAVGASHFRRSAQANERDIFLNITGKNPHHIADWGRWLFTPAPALSFVDRGVVDAFGTFIPVRAHRQQGFQRPATSSRTTLARFGDITGAAVLQHLVPLLIVLLLAGAIAQERQRGTLALSLASGVSPRAILAGKALAASVPVAAILVLLIAGGLLSMWLVGSDSPADDLLRLLGMTAVYAVYYAGWIAIALAVSGRAPNTGVATAVLFGLWIVTVGALPKVAALVITRARAQVSSDAIGAGIDREVGSSVAVRASLTAELLAHYGVSRVQDLPFYFEGEYLVRRENAVTPIVRRRWAQAWARYEEQEAWLTAVGILAPPLLVRPLSASMAGTDLWHTRHYFDAAEGYRFDFVQTLNRFMRDHMRIQGTLCSETMPGCAHTGDEWETYDAGRQLLETVPEFGYASPPAVAAFSRQAVPLAALLTWCGMAWAAAFWSTRRLGALS